LFPSHDRGGGGANTGGSGVIIVRAPACAVFTVAPGCNTITTAPGGEKIATFTVSGTLTV